MYSVISDVAIKEGKDDEESKELIFDQVHVGTIAQFIFDVASDPATTDRYRKSLYDMHKAFMRRLKEVGKDVVLNETEQSDEDDDMEKDGEEAPGSRRNLKQSDEKSTSASEEESTDEEVNIAVSKTVKEETKSKKRKDVNEDDAINEVEVGTPPPKKKSRKQKKKTKESRDDSGSKFDREREEEVVTISLSDQKKAKNQYQQAKKQKHKVESKGEKSPEIDASGKRVKWLSSNKSKSYKASMKGLLSASLPVTSKVTPEKSILLNKGKVRRAGVTAKTGRKKAVNYF